MTLERAELTEEQRASWDEDGFLLLRGALNAEDVAKVDRIVDDQWTRRAGNDHVVDVLSGDLAGGALKLNDAPGSIRRQAYKLNNLFGRISDIRGTALHPAVRPYLNELIDGEALVCNSLNFERGSQQDFHIDSWYMPAPNEVSMIAASFTLDDVDTDNGPIVFYPKSHLIPPYRFSDGRINETHSEAPACRAYLEENIAARNLQPVELQAKRGDVFIWHGQLLHGGKAINDLSRTRKSLVIHYWRKQDLPESTVRTDDHGSYLGHTLRGEIAF